jgi:hypothetical protein
MLPDRIREKLITQVVEYFECEDSGLKLAALDLQDAGWGWLQMRPLLVRVFNAGYGEGVAKAESE